MACGLPVCAYRSKGPADIIVHEEKEFLSENSLEMSIQVSRFVSRAKDFQHMRKKSLDRAAQYSAEKIMANFLEQLKT